MKICLVTAPTAAEFDHVELNSETVQQGVSHPQLGTLTLAAVLEGTGNTPAIVDLNCAYRDYVKSTGSSDRGAFTDAVAALLAAEQAQVFGFSTICGGYPLTIRIARALKTLRPDCTILLGGPQASVVDRQTLAAFPFVDLILRGESEQTLPLVLDALDNSGSLECVPGLTYRAFGEIRRTCSAPLIRDLDALPSPAYHLTQQLRGADNAALELGRGCPFSCTFCSTNDFFRRNFRLRSAERILCDMRNIHAEYGIREFDLVHDMFTVDRRRVVLFCRAMIASGEGFRWSCSARTDCIDEELIELMAQAGCGGIFYGIETGSVRMQKVIDKGLDPHRAEEIIEATERHRIRSTVSLITGFPDETWDDLRDSVRIFLHSARLPGSSPQLNLLAPLAETPLHTQYKDRLVLDELCSDVSQQGVNLDAVDLGLIRSCPEIFPNFYLIPSAHLDRSCLLELREFSLGVDGRFRWLYVALDHPPGDFLSIFLEWRHWRLQLHPELKGFSLRDYYRKDRFRAEFGSFLHDHPAGKTPLVEAFLHLDRVMGGLSEVASSLPAGALLSCSEEFIAEDVPVTTKRIRLLTLPWNIQRLIEGLRMRTAPVWETGPHYYITKEVSSETDQLVGISAWVAVLLQYCDGSHTIADVAAHLKFQFSEAADRFDDEIWPSFIARARAKGYLDIYRAASEAAASQSRAGSIAEYSETSACTSEQKQASAQLR